MPPAVWPSSRICPEQGGPGYTLAISTGSFGSVTTNALSVVPGVATQLIVSGNRRQASRLARALDWPSRPKMPRGMWRPVLGQRRTRPGQ